MLPILVAMLIFAQGESFSGLESLYYSSDLLKLKSDRKLGFIVGLKRFGKATAFRLSVRAREFSENR